MKNEEGLKWKMKKGGLKLQNDNKTDLLQGPSRRMCLLATPW